MIRISIESCKWGSDEIDDGLQFNFLDEKSEIMFHVPFNEEALDSMIDMIQKHKEGIKDV